MDDFELLEESPIELVRENDVITLKLREGVAFMGPSLLKRKADSQVEQRVTTTAKRRKLSNSTSQSTSSSENSDSSDSDSSSTSTSSSSESDSSSPSDSVPSIQTTHKVPITPGRSLKTREKTHSNVHLPLVPPGFGKASTQSRNRRRKIKRKLAAGQIPADDDASAPKPKPIEENGDDASIVLPYKDPITWPVAPVVAVSRTPSSLGNRNKSKGFKKAMEGAVPRKVVFETPIRHASSPSAAKPQQQFISPSERDNLPSNIFVTSVDVEWRTGKGRTHWQNVDEKDEDMVSEDITVVRPSPKGHVDWIVVETKWKEYDRVEESTTLVPGAIVAWKAFGLDPITLTPQASLLHLGKIMAVEPENLFISSLTRPVATFGRASIEDAEDVDSAEQTAFLLKEVWSNDWRLVSES